MATARNVMTELGFVQVSSYVNSGNLLFSASRKPSESTIRSAMEDAFGVEITTLVRTARQVKALATEKPFGVIAPGHTHFALLTLNPLTAAEKKAVEALSNDHDEVVVRGRDVHWLVRSRSPWSPAATAASAVPSSAHLAKPAPAWSSRRATANDPNG